MRAVGVISTGGSTFCTGSLLNNTAGDHKMYFITANHCGISSFNAASLVVYWNYQNSFCRTPGRAASGQPGDGPLNQFHTGSFFRASYAASDVTLVELDDPPVAAYNHRWAGWDRSAGTGPTGTGFLRAYPGGVPPPLASVISFSAGQTRANNAILPLAADGNGTLTFEAGLAAGSVHLIVDVNGYFQ